MEVSEGSGRAGRAHVMTWVPSGVALLGVGGILAFSWLFAGFTCDARCYASGSWTTTADAWQWNAIGWLALAAAALAAAALRRAWRGASRTAGLLSATAASAYAAEWVLVNHASANTAGDFIFWLLAEAVVLFIAVAVALRDRPLKTLTGPSA